MDETVPEANERADDHRLTRRRFLGLTVAGGAAALVGGALVRAAPSPREGGAAKSSTFEIGGDLPVNRLGFGAMRITGEGIWGWPADRAEARRVLRRAVEL